MINTLSDFTVTLNGMLLLAAFLCFIGNFSMNNLGHQWLPGYPVDGHVCVCDARWWYAIVTSHP